MSHEQHALKINTIKGRQIGFAHTGRRLHHALGRTLLTGAVQGIQGLDLCTAGLEQIANTGIFVLLNVVALQILGHTGLVPAFGIALQHRIIHHNGMMLEQIIKGFIKGREAFLVNALNQPIIPLDARGQRAAGDVGGANKNLALIPIMKDIGLGMEGARGVVIKAQIHPIAQLFFNQIQRRRLSYAQIVAREQPNFYTAVQGALQIL